MTRCLILLPLTLLASRPAGADIVLTFDVTTDRTSYDVGETINWSLFVTSSATEGETFNGIGGLSINLAESAGDLLSPATIDPQWASNLYSVDAGTVVGSAITEITVLAAIPVVPVTPLGSDGAILNYATGSFTASSVGAHTLNPTFTRPDGVSVEGDNSYLDTSDVFTAFGSSSLNGATFSVVPEPSSMQLMMVATALLGSARIWGWIKRRSLT